MRSLAGVNEVHTTVAQPSVLSGAAHASGQQKSVWRSGVMSPAGQSYAWNFSGSAPVTEDERSGIINGAASEEISGQYFAAIRRNIDHVDAQ